jgi:hypothetical protein
VHPEFTLNLALVSKPSLKAGGKLGQTGLPFTPTKGGHYGYQSFDKTQIQTGKYTGRIKIFDKSSQRRHATTGLYFFRNHAKPR